MSSLAAPRCRHIKVNGTQCGSPALRKKSFCFYHQQNRPLTVECYSEGEYATGEIDLPVFEDAHSIQTVIRQIVQMVLQKRIERKTAGLLLYALQIASSNLKRIDLEKPQPEQVAIDLEMDLKTETPMAANIDNVEDQPVRENSDSDKDRSGKDRSDQDLPPGTIQACYQPFRSCSADTPVRVRLPPASGGPDSSHFLGTCDTASGPPNSVIVCISKEPHS